MFDHLMTQIDMTVRYGYSLSLIRSLAGRKDFPPCEHRIGNVKFYHKDAVADYFASRIDRRLKENRQK